MLPATLWFVTAFAAGLPGFLLVTNAESRLAQGAAAALLLAGVIAASIGAACAWGSFARAPALSAVVVLLCLAAPVILDVDGAVSPQGRALFGWVAAVLAALAGLLTLRADPRGTQVAR